MATAETYFDNSRLLQGFPVKRAAYSDRTAWLMAELARLAYESFEKPDFIKQELDKAGFELLRTFSKNDSDAFLAVRHGNNKSSEGMLVIAFRGTEMTAQDIHADIKADLVTARQPASGKVHRGFQDAFQEVQKDIQKELNKAKKEHPEYAVYITGHSLGGALALLATKYLSDDSFGAAYTFGAPRAADDEFFKEIKTPVYRVANASDIVTRVPFGRGLSAILSFIRLIPLNFTKNISEFLRKKMKGYTHYGAYVYLSPSTEKEVDEAGIAHAKLKVLHSPNIFSVTSTSATRWFDSKGHSGAEDHRMTEYSSKLKAHAQRRLW